MSRVLALAPLTPGGPALLGAVALAALSFCLHACCCRRCRRSGSPCIAHVPGQARLPCALSWRNEAALLQCKPAISDACNWPIEPV